MCQDVWFRCDLVEYLWIKVSHKVVVKLLSKAVVSSEGSTGRGSNSDLIHMVFGRINSQIVGLRPPFICCHMDFSIENLLTQQLASLRASEQESIIESAEDESQSFITSHHFYHIILARGESISPAYAQGERITQAYE